MLKTKLSLKVSSLKIFWILIRQARSLLSLISYFYLFYLIPYLLNIISYLLSLTFISYLISLISYPILLIPYFNSWPSKEFTLQFFSVFVGMPNMGWEEGEVGREGGPTHPIPASRVIYLCGLGVKYTSPNHHRERAH